MNRLLTPDDIADLLGVPAEDHKRFVSWLGGEAANAGSPDGAHSGDQVFANFEPWIAKKCHCSFPDILALDTENGGYS